MKTVISNIVLWINRLSEYILKYQNALKWTMTILFLFSAFMIGLKIDASKIGFITFLIAHIIGVAVFLRIKDKPMLFHNLLFGLVDIFSIYRWFS